MENKFPCYFVVFLYKRETKSPVIRGAFLNKYPNRNTIL